MADDDEPDDHVPIPKKGERSITTRQSKQHQTNCEKWMNSKKPWNCNAHHILPVTCFNPIEVSNDKRNYVIRCIWVSKWNINGGNKFKTPKEDAENNMVRLPLFSAYKKRYPNTVAGQFKEPHPENKCMHNSRYSEHYLYNKQVRKWLNDNVWSTLQENKEKHKGKGKDIKKLLENGVKYFRGELVRRGGRGTSSGNVGTKACWLHRKENKQLNVKEDKEWTLPFSMADDPTILVYGTKWPI